LFIGGLILVISGYVYLIFGVPNYSQYFVADMRSIGLVNDRFSASEELEG
jgi:cytochrome b559 alpha subunit